MDLHKRLRKWLPENAAYDRLLQIQTESLEEQNILYAQGHLFDWQQNPMTQEQANKELADLILRADEYFLKQQKPSKNLAIVQRVIEEHKDCQSCPVCLTDPSPTLPPLQQAPPPPPID